MRELEAVPLRAMVALSRAETLRAADLESHLSAPGEEPRPAAGTRFPEDLFEGRGLEELKLELERAYLQRLYRKLKGDLRKMMTALGVRQSHLYAWFRKVGIDICELRGKTRRGRGPRGPA